MAATLLSDADVGFGSSGPKLLSDADVGFKPPAPEISRDPELTNQPAGVPGLPQSLLARLSGTDRPAADAPAIPDTVDTRDTIAPGLRSALAPAANTTYGSILPFAKDDTTGDVRLAMPSSIRSLATGALDLAEGPTTGTVTPEATNLLANVAMSGGLTPSPARGAGAPITARDVQTRDNVPIMEAWRRANAENTRPADAIKAIGDATDINGVIAAAGKAAEVPGAAPVFEEPFAPQPVGKEEIGRAEAMGDQAAASAQPGDVATLDQPPESGASPYAPIPKEPKRLIQFLRESTTLQPGTIFAKTIPGGVQDVGGDIAAAIGGPTGRPGLINNKAGRPLDDATLDAWQAGYFPEHDKRPEINDLLNAIREDHTGNAQYSMHDADAAVAHQYAQAHNAEIERLASQTGIDPTEKTRDQFFDAVSNHLSLEDQATLQQSAEDTHQKWFDNAVASAKSDGADYGSASPRSLAELENEYRQEETARTALNRSPNDAGSGSVPQDAGVGQEGSGNGGGVAGTPGRSSPSDAIPRTSADAKAIGHAWYQKAEQSNAELPAAFSNKFVDDAESLAPQTEVGRAVAGDTEVTKLIDRLQAIRDQPISLQGAQEIYEHLGDAISKEYGLQGLSKDGHNLLNLQSKFWDMIQNAGPGEITGGPDGFLAWEKGRDAWAQAMKMIDVERIINRAQLTDNPATSIKSGVRVLLSSKRIRGYDATEVQALKDAGNRGVVGGLLHVFGSRLIPYAAGAAGSAGGPLGAILGAGAGYLSSTGMRNAATFMQMRRANNAMSVLGSRVPRSP